MRLLTRIVLSMLIAGCPALAPARCIVRRNNVIVQERVVVNEIVTPAFVAVPVIVPLYGASYTPAPQLVSAVYNAGYGTVAPAAQMSDTQLILAKLDAMEKRLTTLESGGNIGSIKKPAETHPGLLVLNNKCASCHDVSKPAPNAPPFLEAGHLVKTFDGNMASSIMLALFDESMPKKGDKLTQEEHAQVLDYFKSLRQPAAKPADKDKPPPSPMKDK